MSISILSRPEGIQPSRDEPPNSFMGYLVKIVIVREYDRPDS